MKGQSAVAAMRARKAGSSTVYFEPDDLRVIEAIRQALAASRQPSDIPVTSILLRGLGAYLREITRV